MSHHNKEKIKKREIRPPHFRDSVGKGKLDSTPIQVPTDFNTETGTGLDPVITTKNTHPGPFAGASFKPSSQKFFGLAPRRNTANDSPERAGRILMDDKIRENDMFYEPRIKTIHRNFAKKK